ncbi:MAG: N-acetylmuramoyl-L-alanine amidase [Clostridia bacterium]|nr:N-acetylmuramoyl-L-alanine amidase [Clostridia bacterium]
MNFLFSEKAGYPALKIYIDQGHNPENPNSGAEGNGFREQDLVYEIGQQTAARLRGMGFDVRLSRPTPSTQLGTSVSSSLAARVNDANNWGADYFISLHANSSEIPSASGTEAFVYRRDSAAEDLADDLVLRITEATGLEDRGVFARPGLYVLRKTRMPAVLVELGFITNRRDAELMAYSPGLFAAGIANGLMTYLRSI